MSKPVSHSYFYARRLNSLFGLMIGFIVLWQCYVNSYAFGGSAVYDKYMSTRNAFPLTGLFEILFVAVPILFHAVMGLINIYTSKNNFLNYSYYKNWIYFLQRVSGVFALVFIVVYAWEMRISTVFDGRYVTFDDVRRMLGPGWAKWFYFVGILSVAFYLAVGFSTFLAKWGVTVSRRSQKMAEISSWVIFAVLSIWGSAILFVFF